MLSCRKRDAFKRKAGKKINCFKGAKNLKKKNATQGSNPVIERQTKKNSE